jgi:GNAT superfamily N-acetyltransferase
MIEITVRPAKAGDAPVLLRMMRELARHDGMADSMRATEATLLRDAFGAASGLEVVIAESGGEVAGYVSFTEPYAAWRGGTYLAIDDVYVREPFRGKGVGKAMMLRLRDIARERGLDLRWEMEVENEKARGFYEKLGAKTRVKRICYWEVTG